MSSPEPAAVPAAPAPLRAGAGFFSRPLWPDSRLNRTTAGHLVLSVLSVVTGGVLYARGYTYEGSLIAYMLTSVVLAQPYFLALYRPWMPLVLLASQLPRLIYAQNRGVAVGNWTYRADSRYLLGKITEAGEGPFQWTRFLWFGNTMPATEYFYYPAMGYFQITLFTLFLCLLPSRLVRTEKSGLGKAFVALFAGVSLGFVGLLRLRARDIMDYNWVIFAGPLVVTWLALAFSQSFRRLTRTPAFWLWLVGMGCVFMPVWEFFHCCINRDWIYVAYMPMPPLYTYNGVPIPVVEPFGYIGAAVIFPALLSLLRDYLGRWLLRQPEPSALPTAVA